MSDGETSIYTGSSYQKAVSTLHVVLENGSDLHVNERQKIRHSRRLGPLENKNKNKKVKWRFFTSRGAHLNCTIIIHSFYWKSAVEHDGGV